MARLFSMVGASLGAVTFVALGVAACGSKAPAPDAAAPTAASPTPDAAVTPAPDAAQAPTPDAEALAPDAAAPAADAVAPAVDAVEPSADAAPVAPTYYLGRLSLPSGIPLKVMLTVTGPTAATLSVPAQGMKDAALTEVSVSETGIAFSFLPPGAPPAAVSKFSATRAAGAELYEGKLTASGAEIPVRFWPIPGPEAMVAKRPQTPSPPFPYKTEEVRIPVDGAELGCTLSLPNANGAVPLVVFLTGSGVQDRDETIFDHKPFLVLGDALARAGVASLRCDDRGAGTSSGDPTSVDAAVFAADAEAMLKAVRGRIEIDPAKVGLLGHSEGGMTAAAVAAKAANKVAFVVTVSGPALTGREILVRQNADMIMSQGVKKDAAEALTKAVDDFFGAIAGGKDQASIDAATKALAELVWQSMDVPGQKPTVEELTANFGGLAKLKWLKGFISATPAADLAKTRGPLLALFGEKDTQVRAPENAAALQAAVDKAKKKDVTIETVPGANHLFQEAKTGEVGEYDEIEQTMEPSTVARIVAWVVETTGAKK